ncbi:g319 [Coccomyxa elongata]
MSAVRQDSRSEIRWRHYACCAFLDPHDLFKDKVYNYENWQKHRSWRRHFPEGLVCLQVFAWYWPPVAFVALVGVCVGLYATLLQPRGAPIITRDDYTVAFTITSFALALLLVFRTNTSYDRWWEARKMWGQMLNITRNLVRQVLTWGPPEQADLKEKVVRWTIALVFALKAHLRRKRNMTPDLEDVLLPHELAWLHKQPHFPVATTQVLSAAVRLLEIPDFQKVTIDQEISNYHVNLAACERLFGQPIPIAYTRHTSRFLMTWASFLPFALYNRYQWFTPAVAAVITFLLFGVENIGVQIEQPFDVLPLHTFCMAVKTTIEGMTKCQTEAFDILTQEPPLLAPETILAEHNGKKETVVNLGPVNGMRQA